MKNEDILKIKDSVDLYTQNDNRLIVYYMNTRQKKIFNVSNNTIKILELINGKSAFAEIIKSAQQNYGISESDVRSLVTLLYNQRIVTAKITEQSTLSDRTAERYMRQINYFSEFFPNDLAGYNAQKKICDSSILLFGCGAIGGNIAVQLAMAGVENFTLFDSKRVSQNSLARHIYFSQTDIGELKVEALKSYLLRINPNINIETHPVALMPKTNINKLIRRSSFVINTADEPYIGYTASKISRECVRTHTPLYVAGGFDAHLASTGEIIIPGITPCADCYANYFKKVLKDWKPEKYPERNIQLNEMGGLPSMTLFASSFASVEILKYLARLVPIKEYFKIRGELLFEEFNLNYLNVERNPECPICAGVKYEAKN